MAEDTLTFVDSHCHLADSQYDEDREETIARAAAAGIRTIVCIGAGGPMTTNEAALALARDEPEIVVAVGIHPHDVVSATDASYDQLRCMCASQVVVAIGETGLDFHYNHSPPDVQRAHFRRAVRLAQEVGRPLVIHSRAAFADTLMILREEEASKVGGVIHCFTGGTDEAHAFLDLGFYIGLSGVVTFKNAEDLRAAARMIPMDRMLIETDGPYLAPVPHRGRRNEPSYVRRVAEAVAAARGLPIEAVARCTTENARRFFRLRSMNYE
jgi:TatD DNase family protein